MAKDAWFRVERAVRDLLREIERLNDHERDQVAGELADVDAALAGLFKRRAELLTRQLDALR